MKTLLFHARLSGRLALGAAVLGVLLLLVALPVFANNFKLSGKVLSGNRPIAFANVTLYRAGQDRGAAPTVLGTGQADANGSFTISYASPSDPEAVLYVVATGGVPQPLNRASSPARRDLALAAVLKTAPFPSGVVINERTTVATAYAMAQFIIGDGIGGKTPGLQNAAGTAQNLANMKTGEVAMVLGTAPNGLKSSTMAEFNTLANLLAACVNVPARCGTLFTLATPPRGAAPENTLDATVNIAHNPAQNVGGLFSLAQSVTPLPYLPTLRKAPNAWTIAIKYVGNGHEFDGPGNMVIDPDGNIWASMNYEYGRDPRLPACGATTVSKLTATGTDARNAPFSGGGLSGAGFGIGMDPTGNVWVGNFGFQGLGCQTPPPRNSASKFSARGVALSPAEGFTGTGSIALPQGTVSDRQGNIWIANCGGNSLTQFPHGNTDTPLVVNSSELSKPFAIAVDADMNAWVTSIGNNSVVKVAQDGTVLSVPAFTGGGLERPLGIAIDSLGNVWVANSGVINFPCTVTEAPSQLSGTVTLLGADGTPGAHSPYGGGGMTIPWGIAVDGKDNIWVANFAGLRLSELCGAQPANCPPGKKTGDPISPSTGYTSDALMRNTGIAIDASGNVWLANNWRNIPFQTNPGGDGLVVFVGAAAPVRTPLLGSVQQP